MRAAPLEALPSILEVVGSPRPAAVLEKALAQPHPLDFDTDEGLPAGPARSALWSERLETLISPLSRMIEGHLEGREDRSIDTVSMEHLLDSAEAIGGQELPAPVRSLMESAGYADVPNMAPRWPDNRACHLIVLALRLATDLVDTHLWSQQHFSAPEYDRALRCFLFCLTRPADPGRVLHQARRAFFRCPNLHNHIAILEKQLDNIAQGTRGN